jgi:hypothetical protein
MKKSPLPSYIVAVKIGGRQKVVMYEFPRRRDAMAFIRECCGGLEWSIARTK